MTAPSIAGGGPMIVSGAPSPMGRHWGALSVIRHDDLGAMAIRAAVDRSGLPAERIDEVYAGNVNASGEAMGNVVRFASLLAGLPASSADITMNRYCGSGLSAFYSLSHAIGFGSVRAGVALGVEVMSRSTWPVAIPINEGYPGVLAGRNSMWSGAGGPQHPHLEGDGTMIDMPEGAQIIARRYDISREEGDASVVRSHERAVSARDDGHFAHKVFAVSTESGDFACDETFRRDSTLERLARLKGCYEGCPDITAGNASSVSDGASALVVADAATVAEFELEPLGEVLATAAVGVASQDFSIGPVPVIGQLLSRSGLFLGDVGLFEINEVFAAQNLACVRDLGLDQDRLNVNGGAIALGRALGNSGTRILITLANEMRRRSARFGIASLCVGGGMGVAVLSRNPSV